MTDRESQFHDRSFKGGNTVLLIDYAHSKGVAMGSIGQPGSGSRHIGWTTNEALVDDLRNAGAVVVSGYGPDGRNLGIPAGKDPKSPDTPMGWEISFAQGTEAVLEAQAA